MSPTYFDTFFREKRVFLTVLSFFLRSAFQASCGAVLQNNNSVIICDDCVIDQEGGWEIYN